MDCKIKFIGEAPDDIEAYLDKLYPLLEQAAEGDPGEGEEGI